MFYTRLFECLHACGVRYLVVGGLAVNLHGIPRMTMDVDLVIALDAGNVDGFIECARRLALTPAAPVNLEAFRDPAQRSEWVGKKRMIAFPLRAPEPSSPTVDVLLDHGLDFEAAHARAARIDAGGVPVTVAAIEDLLAMKSGTGRRQDAADVEQLQRLLERGAR
jgi:predicted nucleotidyltransferase